MSLRTKTIYMITLIILSMLVFIGIFSSTVTRQGFERLEHDQVNQLLAQGNEVINDDQNKLLETVKDWAFWDDTYAYMANHNIEYEKSNITPSTFANIRLNLMVLLDKSGKPILIRFYDLQQNRFIPVPASLFGHLKPSESITKPGEQVLNYNGILVLPEGLMMMAARPILNSEASGVARGTLILGRYLEVKSLKELSTARKVTYELIPLPKFQKAEPNLARILSEASNHTVQRSPNSSIIDGFRWLPDIYKQKAVVLSVHAPRTVTRQGAQTIQQFMWLLILCGLVILPITIQILDHSVLRRITNLSAQILNIGASHNLKARLRLSGHDEIATLGNSVNNMLASLQNYQENEEHYQQLLHLLHHEQQSLLNIIEFLPDATVVINQDHKVVSWNRAMEELTGVSQKQMLGQSSGQYAQLLYGEQRPTLLDLISTPSKDIAEYYPEHRANGEAVYAETYIPSVYGGRGAYLWKKAAPLRDDANNQIGAIESIRDISDRKTMENQLRFLSLYDPLTRLHNRLYYQQELSHLAYADTRLFSVVVCDVDGLKIVNDSMGHIVGDRLLQGAAKVLRLSFEDLGVVCRIGGDEFAIILSGVDSAQISDRLVALEQEIILFNQQNPDLNLSISSGFAVRTDNNVSIDEVIKEADRNMYRQKLHHSQSARNTVVRTLMKALGARDIITEAHASRLAKEMELVAGAMGYPSHRMPDLMLLGQFHDVGKVGIPDAILYKPAILTPEEYAEMQQHSEIGYRIAMSAPELAPIARLILTHHEHWDGNGYPLGLKGEDIPIECRILALVDAYDAMTNDRPYRKAMDKQLAMNEISRYAGTQFDPIIAKKYLEILEGSR